MTALVALAADNVLVARDGYRVPGPPFPVTLSMEPGETWPTTSLIVGFGEHCPVLKIETSEPRLKAWLREALEALE